MSVTRKWAPNDKLTLQLPMSLRTEPIEDDRPGYASVQAILFGPYLLAGLTNGDWDIKAGSAKPISDWITSVPPAHHFQLISLAQEFNNTVLFLSNSNNSITMEEAPNDGSHAAVHATFRAVPVNSTSGFSAGEHAAGRDLLVTLEPLDLPGMVVAARGPDGALVVSGAAGADATFRISVGLDGEANAVTLESLSRPGCLIHGAAEAEGAAGKGVRLVCGGSGPGKEASFVVYGGMRGYDPISFVAKGERRNFLLEPLMNLRDEVYTVHFNIGV